MRITSRIEELKIKIKDLTNNDNSLEKRRILDSSLTILSTFEELREEIRVQEKTYIVNKMLDEIDENLKKYF